MKLNKKDIKSLIKECVQRILEVHGAIDDSLSGIADIIIERIKNGETKFTLTKDEISQFYPYKNCPEKISVLVENLKNGVIASYSIAGKTLKVSPIATKLHGETFAKTAIMHELSHFVNDNENKFGLKRINYNKTEDNEKEYFLNRILYLFDNSEMSARVVQFKWAMKSGEIKNSYENVTHLNEMLNLLGEIHKETYTEYYNAFGESDNFGTIIEGLLAERGYGKTNTTGREYYSNCLSEEEFNSAKGAILKRFTKKYKKFKSNIDKITFDLR